ncbi:MAG: PAS domain S-box protein [Cyclobacteriaceae bacterium]|nr:PAS domain S-box protein [Cyclobacteriaceae bacterium]
MTITRKKKFIWFAKSASLFTISVSAAVLLGWLFDIPMLKSISPNWVSMKANTAIGFFLISALFCYQLYTPDTAKKNIILKTGSVFTFLIGLFTLLEYLFQIDLGIDQFFFKDQIDLGTMAPGRMAPFTAINIMLMASCIYFYGRGLHKKNHISDYLILIVLVTSLIPLMGYIYGIEDLYNHSNLTHVAIHSSILFVAISLSILFSKVENGIFALFTKNTNISIIVFRQLFTLIVLILVIAWVRMVGEQKGYYSSEFGVFLIAFSSIVIIFIMLYMGAKSIYKSEKRQQKVTTEAMENLQLFQGVLEAAPDGIMGINTHGTILFVNRQIEILFGYSKQELVGSPVDTLLPEKTLWQDEIIHHRYFKNHKSLEASDKPKQSPARTREGNEFLVEIGLSSLETKNGLLAICTVRDITQKQELEEAVRLSEQRLSTTLASIGEGVISTDVHGKITYMNPIAEAMTGWPLEEARYMNLEDVYLVRDEYSGASVSSPLRRIIKEGLVVSVENHTVLTARDKHDLIISHNGAPIRNLHGDILGAVLVFRDTSERTEAERRLQKSQAQFNTAFFSNPSAMSIARQRDGKFIEVNSAFIKLLEYPRSDLLGKNSEELALIDPLQRKEIWDKLNAFESVKNKETTLKTMSGKLTPVMLSAECIEVENEFCVLTTLIDLSSWKEVEKRYHAIFENTHEGIYQSSPEGKFITANPSMAKMLGYASPEELINSITDISQQIYADPRERERMLTLFKREGKAIGYELAARKKNNEIIWVRANIHIVHKADGEVEYYEGTIEDITERKLATEQLKIQFAELKKTNHELDRFVYSASHDLRAPLASILGVINICELEDLSDTSKFHLGLIRRSINRLDGFIKDILNHSRNSRTELQSEEINFLELLTSAQENLKFMNGSERLKINVSTSLTTPFFGDSVRCGIVIENLLSNAIKYQDFLKEKNTLSIDFITTEVGATIIFHDNGLGIHRNHVPKIFDMFYRATDMSTGSGLGLYIAKECILRMNGTIQVKSELNNYTKFEINIPARSS